MDLRNTQNNCAPSLKNKIKFSFFGTAWLVYFSLVFLSRVTHRIMKTQNNENENIAIARQLSQKFDFYFIALVFTILGLSIQTSSFIKGYFQYIFEISSWAFFLISGLAGLSRLEWIPNAYLHYGSLQIEKNNLKAIKEGLNGRSIINESGEEWTEEQLQKARGDLETQISKRDKKIEKADKLTLIKYQVHKWGFILGLISLIVSRAIINLNSIFQK